MGYERVEHRINAKATDLREHFQSIAHGFNFRRFTTSEEKSVSKKCFEHKNNFVSCPPGGSSIPTASTNHFRFEVAFAGNLQCTSMYINWFKINMHMNIRMKRNAWLSEHFWIIRCACNTWWHYQLCSDDVYCLTVTVYIQSTQKGNWKKMSNHAIVNKK